MREKEAMRAAVRERLAALGPEQRRQAAQQIGAHLATLLATGPVAAYLASPDEVDLDGLCAELAVDGRLLLPRVGPEVMQMVVVSDLRSQIEGVRFRQPVAGLQEGLPATVIVPGRAFDRAGGRLGRGGGHFDRWLTAHPGVRSIGVAFEEQLVDAVPAEDHDRRVDLVVTPRGIRYCGPRSV